MSKPIKTLSLNAPKLGEVTADSFAKFTFAPMYEAAEKQWPDYDIHFKIITRPDSEGYTFFEAVDNALKYRCRPLIYRYTIEEL